MMSVVVVGLPAELPELQYIGQLGAAPARTLSDPRSDANDHIDDNQRDGSASLYDTCRSASLSAAAESVTSTSALHSADDSSVLDTDMDDI